MVYFAGCLQVILGMFGLQQLAHLSIHVGTVHVDLAAIRMDDLADLIHSLLVDTVRGWVCDHQSSQPAHGLLFRFFQYGRDA